MTPADLDPTHQDAVVPCARRVRRAVRRLALSALAVGLAGLALTPAAALAQFQVGLQDTGFAQPLTSSSAQLAFHALQAVHGSTVRLGVGWSAVAPAGTTIPSGFDASNPADPHYDWNAIDTAVRSAAANHAHVILDVTGSAPGWAQAPGRPSSYDIFGGSWIPNAQEYGAFARAIALRYDGSFPDPLHPGTDLPRVTQWEIWNEENLPEYLEAPNPVSEYRSLLNDGYAAIKGVNASNVVAMGGLAPVSFVNGISISPLKFAAEILCLRRVRTHFVRAASCPTKAHLDVLAIHPYSLDATPTKHAYSYNDILVGDVGKLDTLLHTAERLHTALPRVKYGLWADEWSWFTNPPDKQVGDPPFTAARYTAYSMYEMWQDAVSLVIWFRAEDPATPPVNSPSFVDGGGLYTSSGQPKPMMTAFTFPVVARVSHGRAFVWGRAPVSSRSRVIIERRAGRAWKRVRTTRTAPDGVFEIHFQASRNGTYRAQLPHGAVSLGYYSAAIPGVRTH